MLNGNERKVISELFLLMSDRVQCYGAKTVVDNFEFLRESALTLGGLLADSIENAIATIEALDFGEVVDDGH